MKIGLGVIAAAICLISSQATAADCNSLSGNAQRNCKNAENVALAATIKQKSQNVNATVYAACKAASGSQGPAAIDEALICTQIKLGKILESFK